MRRILSAVAVLAILAGCGGGGGGDGGFSVAKDLKSVINVYSVEGGELGITYDTTTASVLGAANRNGDAIQNFVGTLTSQDAWNVTLHIADANSNGTVADDVPFVTIGSGSLTNNGEHVEVHYRIPIENTGIDINIDMSGDLARTVQKSG